MYYKTLITFVLILLIILVILLSVNTRCSSSSSSRSVVKEKFQSKIQKVEKGAFLGFPKSRITYTDTGLETTIDTTDKIFYEFNSPTSVAEATLPLVVCDCPFPVVAVTA